MNKTSQTKTPHASGMKGRHVFWALLAFFGVIIIANITMVTLASSSWNGLWVKDAYNKGIKYNDTLALKEESAQLGWQPSLKLTPTDEPRAYQLQVQVKTAEDAPLIGAQVHLQLKRPTHEGYDQKIDLKEEAAGLYSTKVIFPLIGQWQTDFLITHQQNQMRATRRLIIE